MEEKLTSWNFEDKLKKLATACSRVKGDTARKKASDFAKSYENDIKPYYAFKEYKDLENALSVVKNGFISYFQDKIECKIFIKDISEIKKSESTITVTLSNSNSFYFNRPAFDYIDKIF